MKTAAVQVGTRAVEVMVLVPGVPIFCVAGYDSFEPIYVVQDEFGAWHSLFPVKHFSARELRRRGIHREDDWPPVPEIIEDAWPEMVQSTDRAKASAA